MNDVKMFQVSTLQALLLGYTKPVITVSELLKHGNTGLGTFENVDGEMIVLDGCCYRAVGNGEVAVAEPDRGVPFSSVCNFQSEQSFSVRAVSSINELKDILNNLIDAHFGLNSMHVARIDGDFALVDARSEAPYKSMHVPLKEILGQTQTAFQFENIKGTLVCVYYPDYMDGINAAGWHLHFVSEDRKHGGHVFEIAINSGSGMLEKIHTIELRLPDEPAFDTYSLKEVPPEDVKQVEQSKPE